MDQRPHRARHLACVSAAQHSRPKPHSDCVEQVVKRPSGRTQQGGVVRLHNLTAEHHLVMVRMSDGPAHISATHLDDPFVRT
jgi:hypothetical protein